MYEDFLNGVLTYMRALNEACKGLDESKGTVPYVDQVPVFLETELVGWLRDELGGEYAYQDVTEQEREWWSKRPWAIDKAAADG